MTGTVLRIFEGPRYRPGPRVEVYPDPDWFVRQYLAGDHWAVPIDLAPWELETIGAVTTRRNCGECGVSFAPKRADARYCSSPCRQAAYRSRKA